MKKIDLVEEHYKKVKSKTGCKGVYQLYVKRTMDIVIRILIFPLLFLIMFPIAIAIKLEDRGPVFYSSKRLGVGFKEFGMLKFRSMKVNAPDLRNEDGITFNSKNNHRVTKIGRILRETSLNELPQILNVFMGQMSFIGPRAGDVESKETYAEDEKDKLLIRPGITGYTQVYFRNNLGVREKRMHGACYAHSVTFVLDMKILLRTVKTVLFHENIYTN